MISFRGIPTTICPNCDNEWFLGIVKFDKNNYQIKEYNLEMQCNNCGALLSAPTPEDHPNNKKI
jgi:uncharacterized Zn finger protein